MCCLGGGCVGVCTYVRSTSPHSSGRGGDNCKRERCCFPLPPPFLLPFALSLSFSFSCSFSFIATAIRTCPPSLAIILLGYAMHSPPTVTNWCWKPTVTLLSLVVGADPYCHSDCLALRQPLPLDRRQLNGILQLFLLFWNITCQTMLIWGPACFCLAQWRLGITETLSALSADIIMHSVIGASVRDKELF